MDRRSRITAQTVMLLCTVLLLFFVFPPTADSEEATQGYDENTELTIKGVVAEVIREARGPVMVKVFHRGKTYEVVTGPPWFLSREHMSLRPGMEIEVTGSKVLGRDGTLYLVSRRIRDVKAGREVFFRDDSLRPVWRGRRHSFQDERDGSGSANNR